LSGLKTVITSFGSFLTGKNIELRISVAYNNAPVVVVGTHGGLIGPDGATQAGTQDIAVMRSMPRFSVFQPASPIEVRRVLDYCIESKEPSYIRISRNEVSELHDESFKFELGKPYVIKEGIDIVIFSSGPIVHNCLAAAQDLAKDLSIKVVNLITIKPLNVKEITRAVVGAKLVLVFEDHEIYGGLGGAILEAIALSKIGAPIYLYGLDGQFVDSDKPAQLEAVFKLDKEGIRQRIIDNWANV